MVDVESDDPVKQSELEELKNKVSKMNKNLITIMNTVKNIEYNLNNKKEENKENTNDKDKERKERINKAFEKKQIGRPVGSWEDKRKQYFEWITTGKITQPKEETLTYYKINKDPTNNSYVLLS